MIDIRQSSAIASATSSPGSESCFPATVKVRGGIEGITHDDFACALSSFPFMKFGLQYAGADSAGISTDCPEAKYRNHRRMEIIKSVSINDAVADTLTLASQKGFGSISIPAISAGIFWFPKKRCAEIIIEDTAAFLTNSKTTLKEANFYLMDSEIIQFFAEELGR